MLGRKRVNEALALMGKMFPDAHGELEWETPFQLLVAVILSAQTTDKAVNKVTPGLWARYPEIEDLASANLDDVEMCLRTIGLYKNKAKNIIKTARVVLMNFDGQVPKTHKELESLPGVGRKTANVVLAEVYSNRRNPVDFSQCQCRGNRSRIDEENTKERLDYQSSPHDFLWTLSLFSQES